MYGLPRRLGNPGIQTLSGILMADTTGATALAGANGSGRSRPTAQRRRSRFSWWWPTAIAGAVVALASPQILGLVIAVLLIPCIWLCQRSGPARTVVLFYEGPRCCRKVVPSADRPVALAYSIAETLARHRIRRHQHPLSVQAQRRFASSLISSIVAAADVFRSTTPQDQYRGPSIAAGKSALYSARPPAGP